MQSSIYRHLFRLLFIYIHVFLLRNKTAVGTCATREKKTCFCSESIQALLLPKASHIVPLGRQNLLHLMPLSVDILGNRDLTNPILLHSIHISFLFIETWSEATMKASFLEIPWLGRKFWVLIWCRSFCILLYFNRFFVHWLFVATLQDSRELEEERWEMGMKGILNDSK